MTRNGLSMVLVGLAITLLVAADPSYAQTAAQTAPQAAQGKTIFDFKADLKLTDKQEKDIREVLADLNKEIQVGRAKLTILSFELEDLIKKEADLEQIKKNLKDQADVQASMRYADVVATRGVNKVLSPDQLTRWKNIQATAR